MANVNEDGTVKAETDLQPHTIMGIHYIYPDSYGPNKNPKSKIRYGIQKTEHGQFDKGAAQYSEGLTDILNIGIFFMKTNIIAYNF